MLGDVYLIGRLVEMERDINIGVPMHVVNREYEDEMKYLFQKIEEEDIQFLAKLEEQLSGLKKEIKYGDTGKYSGFVS